jgi:cytochrome c oxidase cbb3-type subunit 3
VNETKHKTPEDVRFEHSYDGIEEYDNPMPRWWVYIFWATIAYSAIYLLNVVPGVGEGKGRVAQYQADVAKANETYARYRIPAGPPNAAVLAEIAHDPVRMADARKAYETNCAACHKSDGGGLIGPNLTDEFWIHGGRPEQVWTTIHDGVLDKGMPAWGKVLPPETIGLLAAHVLSLEGTHPKDAKAPQGAKFEDVSEHAGHEIRATTGGL